MRKTKSRLLVVEDDPALLRGLVDKFRSEGYEVRVACDGHSAIDQADEDPPDLVLLDVMLPGCDGFEVCRALRDDSGFTMPIIMLTARGQERDVVRGLNLGADDYITKPFRIAELHARIQAALRRTNGRTLGSRAVYEFGNWVLDCRAQQLRCEGNIVELTSQEFSFLTLFAANPHRALTREAILRAAEKRSSLSGVRTVDRCVKNLRAKIEIDPKHPTHIITIRDVGYRFAP
ncbi:MAG: response regulator transcription factor [Verrucomicrobiae bacterium]|nr:response regulator transcription factor [Verrucomicrobiae bacterium]